MFSTSPTLDVINIHISLCLLRKEVSDRKWDMLFLLSMQNLFVQRNVVQKICGTYYLALHIGMKIWFLKWSWRNEYAVMFVECLSSKRHFSNQTSQSDSNTLNVSGWNLSRVSWVSLWLLVQKEFCVKITTFINFFSHS